MGNSAALRRFPRAGRGPRSAVLLRVASDERLVDYVRGGNEVAFEAIYDRHHRGILAFCRHMLSSAHEAEDAVQHTFMAAYRHLVGGDAEIQLRPWLYTIARNRCLSMLRARREQPLEHVREPATEHLSAEAQRREDVRELLGDVAGLPEDQRAALVLAELGAVSHDEIALVLDVPRQKVKALVFQARTSLAASRKARETPCHEIREQLANLSGGALRRTTLHRHLRECPGCREFREQVSHQRKTLAVALPVIPTLGLKEAVLGGAFGSAGGGTAAASGGALAAKALVTVALVGGGTTAGVEVKRHVAPPAPKAAEPAQRSVAPAAAAPVALRSTPQAATLAAPAAPARHPAATTRGKAKPAEHGRRARSKTKPGDGKADRGKARGHDKPAHVAPGQAKVKPVSRGQAKKALKPAGALKPAKLKAPKAKAKAEAPRGKANGKGEASEPAVTPVAVPTAEPKLKLKESGLQR